MTVGTVSLEFNERSALESEALGPHSVNSVSAMKWARLRGDSRGDEGWAE